MGRPRRLCPGENVAGGRRAEIEAMLRNQTRLKLDDEVRSELSTLRRDQRPTEDDIASRQVMLRRARPIRSF